MVKIDSIMNKSTKREYVKALRQVAQAYYDGKFKKHHYSVGLCFNLKQYSSFGKITGQSPYDIMGELVKLLDNDGGYFGGKSPGWEATKTEWEPRALMALLLAEFLETE
jgi:hypothetical protein